MSQKTVKVSEMSTGVQMDPEREKLSNHSTVEKMSAPTPPEERPMSTTVQREGRIGNRIVSIQNASAILLEKAVEDHRQDLIEIIRTLGGMAAGGEELITLRTVAKMAAKSIATEHAIFKKEIDDLTAPPVKVTPTPPPETPKAVSPSVTPKQKR